MGVVFAACVESRPTIAWGVLGVYAAIGIISSIMTNRCPHCGRQVDLRSKSVKFCPRCGEKIEDAEQGGTGQPATRPESKSESGHKTQPEAEGRSR
jgi:endogenous inhibitor of DNA gyrase (YacG/DUF329 family)